MELLRSGLQLVAIKGLETCEGSVNVPVILKSDGRGKQRSKVK